MALVRAALRARAAAAADGAARGLGEEAPAVGEALLSILEQREFPVGELFPLASERSAGKKVMFKGKSHTVQNLADFDFNQAQQFPVRQNVI